VEPNPKEVDLAADDILRLPVEQCIFNNTQVEDAPCQNLPACCEAATLPHVQNGSWTGCTGTIQHGASCSGQCVAQFAPNGTLKTTCSDGGFVNTTGNCAPGKHTQGFAVLEHVIVPIWNFACIDRGNPSSADTTCVVRCCWQPQIF
jgi:hypothetical protein